LQFAEAKVGGMRIFIAATGLASGKPASVGDRFLPEDAAGTCSSFRRTTG
jgi:hypothetical protein